MSNKKFTGKFMQITRVLQYILMVILHDCTPICTYVDWEMGGEASKKGFLVPRIRWSRKRILCVLHIEIPRKIYFSGYCNAAEAKRFFRSRIFVTERINSKRNSSNKPLLSLFWDLSLSAAVVECPHGLLGTVGNINPSEYLFVFQNILLQSA